MSRIDDDALRILFHDARTQYSWTAEPVADTTLEELYGLLKMAPTALNSQPLRVVFVKSQEAKAKLRPALDAGNIDKTMSAPVTAIVAYDTAFYEQLTKLVPHWAGARDAIFGLPPEGRDGMARLNATLQAGYLILAARGLGLDCGPMGGFKAPIVDEAFFADGRWRSIVLINLGHGDGAKVFPRAPRLEFSEACRIE